MLVKVPKPHNTTPGGSSERMVRGCWWDDAQQTSTQIIPLTQYQTSALRFPCSARKIGDVSIINGGVRSVAQREKTPHGAHHHRVECECCVCYPPHGLQCVCRQCAGGSWPPAWTVDDLRSCRDMAEVNKTVYEHVYHKPSTISLEVPDGFTRETACMSVLDEVVLKMLPETFSTTTADGKMAGAFPNKDNIQARARVAKWLLDKYGYGG